jgi:ATP-binding cassette subfamily G (WHITE) protein 2 (PDR)
MLFQICDRLLLLAEGGKIVYFGDIGQNSRTLIEYFKSKSGPDCSPEENPAEWILDQVSPAPGQHSSVDWPQAWQDSQEQAEARHGLDEMEPDLSKLPVDEHKHLTTFATPFWYQTYLVTLRCFEQYWRTPSYLYSKCALCISPVSLSLLLVF